MPFDLAHPQGLRVTVMGLGLHGGGFASARFFASRGALVTVTDLRDEKTLKPSIDRLEHEVPSGSIRFVLGRHDEQDFIRSDVVVKNPAVPKDSPFLRLASAIETDISIFLRLNTRPIIAITGSKGKSTTAAATARMLRQVYPETKLGGNITVSPLSFIDTDPIRQKAHHKTPVVLELSSWQLGDLEGKHLLKPTIGLITNILHDHMNRYDSMESYVRDKSLLFADQTEDDTSLLNRNDRYTPYFIERTRAQVYYFSATEPSSRSRTARGKTAWLGEQGKGYFQYDTEKPKVILGAEIRLPGRHNRVNLLCAALITYIYGVPPQDITEALVNFTGLPHRMERVGEKRGVHFYNDSAATIPEATVEAIKSFSSPLILILGGTDKNLDFSVLTQVAAIPKTILLLEGSASEKIKSILASSDRSALREYNRLEDAVRDAWSLSEPGDIILFSPGCASFEMFLNEFHRGEAFKTVFSTL